MSSDIQIDRDKPHQVDHDQGPTKLRPKNPHSTGAHTGQRLRSAAGVNALD
jgi:hypothetical protein